jgi:hypothetical protein
MYMERFGHPTASILIPSTFLFGETLKILKNYFQFYQTQWWSPWL